MKKIFLSLVFIFLLSLPVLKVNAQWVTIPDANFVNWLNANGYAGCMNGNLMDTTCNSIVTAITIGCNNSNIANLDGVQYFDNLQSLYCQFNQLSSLPSLPQSLNTLYCHNNSITILPSLPNNLTSLSCSTNQLLFLPALPNSLITLSCGENPLGNLPTLPNSLSYLYCGSNQLSLLPVLPSTLTGLSCEGNYLTYLPTLPTSLTSLLCGWNLLISLPVLQSNLNELWCQHNQLTSLPALPQSLNSLLCYANQLSNLPTLPNALTSLDCSENPIVTLPILPSTIYNLDCNTCLLTSLPDLPHQFNSLMVFNNPNLYCLPKLGIIQTLDFSNTGIQCLPNYGSINNSTPLLSSLPLCDLFNTNNCTAYWNISGKVFSDSNTNCVNDFNELQLANIKLKLDSAGSLLQQTYTGGEGFYSFDTDTGTYTYTVDTTNLPVLVTCPPSGYQTSILTSIDSMDYDMDFGMQCKPGFDVGVFSALRDSGIFFPANFARVHFSAGDITNFYGLQCASGISGNVKIILDSNVTFISSSNGAQVPIVNGDTLIYSIADYGTINANTNFSIIVQTDSSAQVGDVICFDVEVTPTTGDNNISNNTLQHCFTVTNSYDPNTKEVFPAGNIDTTQQWLTYTVHFQNTGTAPAQHIYILDTLSTSVDESTFTLLAYSHQPLTQVINNIVRFNFPNINLPDSTNDEPHSHGYVQYKIKLKNSLPLGTVIKNTAHIVFDFNTPVTTNTTQNVIVNPTSITNIKPQTPNIKLFPNPVTNNILKISFQSPFNSSLLLVLYDITGRKVFSEKINSSPLTQTVSIPKLANGIYTCEFATAGFKESKKLVVMSR